MTEKPLPWRSFVASLPSGNPYNHEFRVCDWLLCRTALILRESGVFRLLNAIQGFAIIIAVIVFVIDLDYRQKEQASWREERIARKLTAISNAYSILRDVAERTERQTGLLPRNRRPMIAIEELHNYSQVDNGLYLAGLIAPGVGFSLIRNRYYSGCEVRDDPKRVVLRGAYLDRAVLDRTSFQVADLTGAHLAFAKLNDANLYYACLKRANLLGSELRSAILNMTDLSDANLAFATLTGAYLQEANLLNANLSYADLSRADLQNANLEDVNITGTNMSHTHLLRTKGLEPEQLASACITSEDAKPRHLPDNVEPPPVDEDC